jgi:benzoate/toluate 1,2-dioxygenase reductase subunit
VVGEVTTFADAVYELVLDIPTEAPVFLHGQYVNIGVPGSGQHRSYSFSSAPGSRRMTFMIKQVPGGLMSGWLGSTAAGQPLQMTGPLGSFYLRAVTRPLLFLAGGTGLAPFLSMLEVLAAQDLKQPVHLIYGVTRDQDLVMVDRLADYARRIPSFTYATCVADPQTTHPQQGYVTQHMPPQVLHAGNVDVYLCGPPPMVDAVQKYFKAEGLAPASFHYEKFTPNQTTVAA